MATAGRHGATHALRGNTTTYIVSGRCLTVPVVLAGNAARRMNNDYATAWVNVNTARNNTTRIQSTLYAVVTTTIRLLFDFCSISIRRRFECLSKVIKVAVT